MVGRTLAGNVLKAWTEDFVDEDTGEVVTIERNEVIIERETVLTEELCELIQESSIKTVLLHKEEAKESDYSIIFNTLQKTHLTPRKRLCCIAIVSCVMQNLPMMLPLARLSKTSSSQRSVMTWVR